MNLISPTTIDEIWNRHFYDSAQLFRLLSLDDETVVNLGSGAGFPGLVLALLARDSGRKTIFNLVEVDSRKAAFLIEVAIATGLMNQTVRIHAVRAGEARRWTTCRERKRGNGARPRSTPCPPGPRFSLCSRRPAAACS